MKPWQGTRALVQGLYPGRETLIDRGLDEDPSFLELCEDYRRCVFALEKLQRPDVGGRAERIREYEELLAELTRELDGCIKRLSQDYA